MFDPDPLVSEPVPCSIDEICGKRLGREQDDRMVRLDYPPVVLPQGGEVDWPIPFEPEFPKGRSHNIRSIERSEMLTISLRKSP